MIRDLLNRLKDKYETTSAEMSNTQALRAAEVISKERIVNDAGSSEHADLAGHCEHCQTAYRIGWEMFYTAAHSAWTNEILNHNLNIRIRHNKWNTAEYGSAMISRRILEHSYAIYSHNWEDYILLTGIRTSVPKQPHKELCYQARLEIDIPIRKNVHNDVRRQAELALNSICQIGQMVYPKGASVVDQRITDSVIETRIKVQIGEAHGIVKDPGWKRKMTFNHGFNKADRAQLRYDLDQASEEEANDYEDSTASDAISQPIGERMELDFDQEAPKPVANQEIKEAPPVAMQPRHGKAPEASSSSYKSHRPRRATVPIPTRASFVDSSNEQILVARMRGRPQERQQQMNEPGPSRHHGALHVETELTEAQQYLQDYCQKERDGYSRA